jgi:hypothetical protein
MADIDKLSAIATHLYVRLRRDGGRVIDAIWMTQNQDYAVEVLRLARAIPDQEVARLIERYEELMFGKAPAAAPPARGNTSRDETEEPERPNPNAGRYRGALR